MALTIKEIQAVKPGEWLSDGGARGGGALVFYGGKSGVILCYFRSTLPNGKRDTMPIGQFDNSGRDGMTLAQARAKAGELSKLYQSGVKDLRAHFAAELAAKEAAQRDAEAAAVASAKEAEERNKYTLRRLCDAYADHLEAQGKVKSAAAVRSSIKCHVPAEDGATPAREVTALQIAAMVRKVREAGKERAAGILRSYLGSAFNCAKRAPFDSAMPADLIGFAIEHNPVEAIPAIAVRAGDRTLNAAELQAYIKVLGNDLPDQALHLALMAGGQRMAQLLRAKVSDYDPDTRTLRLWDTKGRRRQAREHLLPLAPHAAALVARLVKRAQEREEERAKAEGRAADVAGLWLFSSHGKVPVTETTIAHRVKQIASSMKGESFDLRDIRRTVETMLAGLGISKDIRAQLLSHGIAGVQAAHYDRHAYTDEKRAALVAWEKRLTAIEKGEKPASNVRQLRRKSTAAA